MTERPKRGFSSPPAGRLPPIPRLPPVRTAPSSSPMLQRIAREERRSGVRKALRLALLAGGLGVLGGTGAIAWTVFGSPSSSSGSNESGNCLPGENELDCLDRIYEEEEAGELGSEEPDGGVPMDIGPQEPPPPTENDESYETPSAPAYPEGAVVPS